MGEDASIVVSEELILEVATIHGAKALGFGVEGGSIEVAIKADFIVITRDRKLLSLDEEDILVDIRRRNRTVSDRAGLTIGPRWPVL